MTTTEKRVCLSCQGSGKCAKCGGAGNTVQNLPTPIPVVGGEVRGKGRSSRMCNACYGSGMCQTCKGSGKAK